MSAVAAAPPVVPSDVLEDLRRRVAAFRPVAMQRAGGWTLGIDPDYLRDLLRDWADGYDWREVEGRLQALPWVVAGSQNASVRLVQQRSDRDDAVAVVLLHGWPDSVMRFEKVLPMLRDVHVLVPALPGFPFSAATAGPVKSAADMAAVIADAVAELGYDRYVLSAGDVGTDVAESWAAAHPDRVVGLHLTDLSHRHVLFDPPTDLSPAEQTYREAIMSWHQEQGAYNHQQSAQPNTLAVALGDSPAGLAAWIVEKLHSWSDCGGDLESVFTRQQVLDWVTAYWVTGSIGTSFYPYAHRAAPPLTDVPTAFTLLPANFTNAPRTFAERFFNVRSWKQASGGGHFDAWERPGDYADGVRAAIEHRRV